jgi:hypothetical protein
MRIVRCASFQGILGKVIYDHVTLSAGDEIGVNYPVGSEKPLSNSPDFASGEKFREFSLKMRRHTRI